VQPIRFDFPVITNSDYTEELSFEVGDQYFDLTGHSFLAQVRLTPNSSTVIFSLPTVGSIDQQGFFPIEPASGKVQVKMLWETVKAAFASQYPGYLAGDEVSLYYDLLVTLPNGDQEVWTYGYIKISKGITNG